MTSSKRKAKVYPSSSNGDRSAPRRLLVEAVGHFRAGRLEAAEARARAIPDGAPEAADALHLRGVIARQRRRPNDAVALLTRAIAINPDLALAHFNLGNALYDLGRRDEAGHAYARAAALAPDVAPVQSSHGSMLRATGDTDAAVAAFARAIAADPGYAPAHNGLGNARRDQGRIEDAVAAFEQAIAIEPDYAEALLNLAAALLDRDETGAALARIERAIALRPDLAPAHVNLGYARLDAGDVAAAARAFDDALALAPDLAEAHVGLGRIAYDRGRPDDAIAHFRRAIASRADFARPHAGIALAALAKGDAVVALDACDACLAVDPGNRYAIALKAVALGEAGEREDARALVDFDRLIARRRIATPPGFASLAAFNAALADAALNHPSLAHEPHDKATRNGRQTRELFIDPEGALAALRAEIETAVDAYLAAHPADPDHPWLAHPPRRWRLTAWATVLGSQGHQAAHIHPSGWLSGVYYVALPPVMSDASEESDHRAGWIVFGDPGAEAAHAATPETRLYRPEEGCMFLFPSYVYHHTLPFAAAEPRISIAFDVLPLDAV